MKGIYWRPKGISIRAMVLAAILAVGSVATVEYFKKDIRQKYYEEKLAAAQLAADGMAAIKHYRVERGDFIDTTLDPAETGILGLPHTPVTTNAGGYFTKRTSSSVELLQLSWSTCSKRQGSSRATASPSAFLVPTRPSILPSMQPVRR
ncbi:MAG: hypothetical protein R3F19_22705 [Verrucomicrobiales bacterium]